MGEEPVIADGDTETAGDIGDRQYEQVLPMKTAAPRKPSPHSDCRERQDGREHPHDALERFVFDRDDVGDRAGGQGHTRRGLLLKAVFDASPASVSMIAKRLPSKTTRS